jgi:hypothetical protein
MAKLNDFISSVAGEGLMRTSRFAVTLKLPNAMPAGNYIGNLRKILLYCDNVNLPGISLETTQAKTFGEFREMPFNKLFDNINMGFYVDNAMSVKLLFDNWMSAIQNPTTRNFNYYADYTTDITIDVFDVANKNRYKVTLYQCYPKAINPIQMDYAGREVMKMSVSMNYKYWKSSSAGNNVQAVQPNGILNQVNKFLGDAIKIPQTYFTNFTQFQNSVQSFENVNQNSLYPQTTAGFGTASMF